MLNLPGCIDRRIILDRFTDEPTAHGVDRTMRKFQNGAPGGLERDGPSCLGENWVEPTDSRLGAGSGDPLKDIREAVKPWIKRKNPNQFEYAAERRQGQHAIGLVKLSADPTSHCHDRAEQYDPDDADRNVVQDMRH